MGLTSGQALACLLLNIFLMPIGSFVHACLAKKAKKSVIIGIAQIVLTVFIPVVGAIIAWIMGIVHCVKIYQKTIKKEQKRFNHRLQVPLIVNHHQTNVMQQVP